MSFPAILEQYLQTQLSDAKLIIQTIPDTRLKLWLISPHNMQQRVFSTEEIQHILQAPPYWCFCWSSGAALARWLLTHPEQVMNKKVLDFGAGSGCVAIAAALAGARKVTVCDLDVLALTACQANAELNSVQLDYLADFNKAESDYDLIVAADILYDRDNFVWLNDFPEKSQKVLLADSRVKDFQYTGYELFEILESDTLPDLLEPLEFRKVRLYQYKSN